ncbi:hypothetical protein BJF81_06715 [Ornithinimicrobium sp. CNJ-824]|nr:hypothetical protein BJF80_01720 [Serinicoccus sp. CUA-874]OLT20062.1 hypothetical protein BJF81_06715 [Ornithinimicrobium sp. CNJ-824]
MSYFCWNAIALGTESRLLTPMNCTGSPASRNSVATFSRSGVSSMHGPHHEPQTLITTTSPRWSWEDHASSSRVVPSSVITVSRSFGASA